LFPRIYGQHSPKQWVILSAHLLSSTFAVMVGLGGGRGGCPPGGGDREPGREFPHRAAFAGGGLAPPTTPAPAPTAATSGRTAAVPKGLRYAGGPQTPTAATASGVPP